MWCCDFYQRDTDCRPMLVEGSFYAQRSLDLFSSIWCKNCLDLPTLDIRNVWSTDNVIKKNTVIESYTLDFQGVERPFLDTGSAEVNSPLSYAQLLVQIKRIDTYIYEAVWFTDHFDKRKITARLVPTDLPSAGLYELICQCLEWGGDTGDKWCNYF